MMKPMPMPKMAGVVYKLSKFLKHFQSSDELENPSSALFQKDSSLVANPVPWRSSKREAWIEFAFSERFVIEGFSIRWWGVSHAASIQAESAITEHGNFSSLHVANLQDYGKYGRVTVIKIHVPTDNIIGLQGSQLLRLKFSRGTLDNIYRRYYFGISEIEIYGSPSEESIRPVSRKDSMLAQVQMEEKTSPRGLIGWKEILRIPLKEKATKRCRAIRSTPDNVDGRRDVRMGLTAAPFTYSLTPRRRKKEILNRTQAQAAKLRDYPSFQWGAPQKPHKVPSKPVFVPVGVSDENVGAKITERVRPKRPDSRGTVSTRASTPIVRGVKSRPPAFDASQAPSIMGSELPYGWVVYTTDEGKVYYHNSLSNETTWTKPAREPPVPPGWVAHETDEGRRYYHKIGTNETTWTRPAPLTSDAIDGSQLDWQKRQTDEGETFYVNPSSGVSQWEAPTMFDDIDDDAILPPNWGKETNSDGETYYFNSETGESTWNHPVPVPVD